MKTTSGTMRGFLFAVVMGLFAGGVLPSSTWSSSAVPLVEIKKKCDWSPSTADVCPKHIIVLIGLRYTVEKSRHTVWSKENDEYAKRLHNTVLESLNGLQTVGLPTANDKDLLSVIFYKLDGQAPSYRPEDMFASNIKLRLIEKEKLEPELFQQVSHFDSSENKWKNATSLTGFFSRLANDSVATTLSLPWLNDLLQKTGYEPSKQIGKTILIRIATGSSSHGTGEQESINAIYKVIEEINKKKREKGEVEISKPTYVQEATARANAITKIGNVPRFVADCVSKLEYSGDAFGVIDCENVGQEIDIYGNAIVSYLELEPPAVSTFFVSSEKATMERLGRNGRVFLREKQLVAGAHEVKGTGYRLIPQQVLWRYEGPGAEVDWKECQENGLQKKIDCHKDGIVEWVKPEKWQEHDWRGKIRYWYLDRLQLDGFPFSHYYAHEKVVDVEPAAENKKDSQYYKTEKKDSLEPITDNVLKEKSKNREILTPRMLFDESKEKEDAEEKKRLLERAEEEKKQLLERTEEEKEQLQWLAEAVILAFLLVFLWWRIPKGNLIFVCRLQAENEDEVEVEIDFNRSPDKTPRGIATMYLRGVRSGVETPLRHPLRLSLVLIREAEIDAGSGPGEVIRWRGTADSAISFENRNVSMEADVYSGREIFLYFYPSQVEDAVFSDGQIRPRHVTIPWKIEVKAEYGFFLWRWLLPRPRVEASGQGVRSGNGQAGWTSSLRLQLIPEKASFQYSTRDCNKVMPKSEGELAMVRHTFKMVHSFHTLCRYLIANQATHRFGEMARGRLSLVVRDAKGETVEQGFLLQPDEHIHGSASREKSSKPTQAYSLFPSDSKSLVVVLDPKVVTNPVDESVYTLTLYNNDKPLDVWNLLVERSRERTDIVVQLLDDTYDPTGIYENLESHILHESVASNLLKGVGAPFRIPRLKGDKRHMVVSTAGDLDASNQQVCYARLRLHNRCVSGPGHALWSVQVKPRLDECEGIRVVDLSKALPVQISGSDEDLSQGGKLDDSHDPARNSVFIDLNLHPKYVEFLQEQATLVLDIIVDWTVWSDGKASGRSVEFTESFPIHVFLKHVPARHVLTIDFGTSAIAVGHAIGEASRLVSFWEMWGECTGYGNRDFIAQKIMGSDSHDRLPFLSSMVNVRYSELMGKDGSTLVSSPPFQPEDSTYLELPVSRDALSTRPESVVLMLKLLLAMGFNRLNIDVMRYPFLDSNGNTMDRGEGPKLDLVLTGLYRNLRKFYLDPILTKEFKKYAYLVATHPNTYTSVHKNRLRTILENSFLGGAGQYPLALYPENIILLGESDAVAWYYLLEACRVNLWEKVPMTEQVFIYDLGAGTLDMTWMEIAWGDAPSGETRIPKVMTIKRRAGFHCGGFLMDECIIRDLHDFLERFVADLNQPTFYQQPLVRTHDEEIDNELRVRWQFAVLGGLGDLKREASSKRPIRFQLNWGNDTWDLLKSDPVALSALADKDLQLEVNETGNIYWTPDLHDLERGKYLSAYFTTICETLVTNFFGGEIPTLHTVLVTGRATLWPGLVDRVCLTVNNMDRVFPLKRTPEELKGVVATGAAVSLTRWLDQCKLIESPDCHGIISIRYEWGGVGKWRTQHLEVDNAIEIDLSESSMVQLGEDTATGFNLIESYPREDLCPDLDKRIQCTLSMRGKNPEIKVRTSSGSIKTIREFHQGNLLTPRGKAWPFGNHHLTFKSPNEVMGFMENRS